MPFEEMAIGLLYSSLSTDPLAPICRGEGLSGKFGSCRLCHRRIQRPPRYILQSGGGEVIYSHTMLPSEAHEQDHFEPVGPECAKKVPTDYLWTADEKERFEKSSPIWRE